MSTFAALTGSEILYVNGVQANGQPAATQFPTTTGLIADLAAAGGENNITETAISTVGAGTLTAAALVGGQILRTGSTANYTDTTDTAANIIAALPSATVGDSFFVRIKNATAFTETLAAGTGVTLPATTLIPAFSVGNYFVKVTSATAVSFTHMSTTEITSNIYTTIPALVALTTVGAGTILAADIVSGYTARGGAQTATAFTDTTDTAANIIAAAPGLVNKIGTANIYTYVNNTNAPATLTGGTGVTVSGVTVVPANSSATFVITYTAAATITMVGVGIQYIPQSGTFVANGASAVTVTNANVSPGSNIIITLKTVGGTVGAIPHLSTVTPGTGFTVVGTASDTSTYNYTILG